MFYWTHSMFNKNYTWGYRHTLDAQWQRGSWRTLFQSLKRDLDCRDDRGPPCFSVCAPAPVWSFMRRREDGETPPMMLTATKETSTLQSGGGLASLDSGDISFCSLFPVLPSTLNIFFKIYLVINFKLMFQYLKITLLKIFRFINAQCLLLKC